MGYVNHSLKHLSETHNRLTKLEKRVSESKIGKLEKIDEEPTEDNDICNKKYVDEEIDSLFKTLDDFATLKNLDDFATIKYVDDELQKQDQGDESSKVDLSNYYEKKDVDTYIKNLKDQHKLDISSLTSKLNTLENKFSSSQQSNHYIKQCLHNNEHEVEFNAPDSSLKNYFSVSNDKKTMTIKQSGIWQITVIDQVKESGIKSVEMHVKGLDLAPNNNVYYQKVRKSSKWESFYFSRILPLKNNAEIKIRFSAKKSNSGFDGTNNSRVIIKKYT